MKYVFELKVFNSNLGQYNATKVFTVFVISDNLDDAINHVLSRNTITVEIVSTNPCLIVK